MVDPMTIYLYRIPEGEPADQTRLDLFGEIYRLIFKMPVLKYNKISAGVQEILTSLPSAVSEKFSSIEHLVINYPCTLNALITMLSSTPQLRRLNCGLLYSSDQSIETMIPIKLANLTDIVISQCNLTFDEFQMFVRPISSKVRLLRITTSKEGAYLDADQWEKIISQNMPHLHKFNFQYDEYVDTVFQLEPYHTLINRFTSQFWIERRWFLEIDIKPYFPNKSGSITISIHSHTSRPGWYDLQEHLKNKKYYAQSAEWNIIQHITMPRRMKVTNSQSTRLIVISEMHNMFHNDCANRNRSFIDRMKPSFTMIHITHLEVYFEEIFADTFTEFLHLFPNLDSLKISCRLLNHLSVEDLEIALSVKNNNKITKLSLWWMIRSDHACFIVDLFPFIEYLEIDCSNFIHPELFLRHVFLNNIKLSSMSLFFDRIEDRLVNNLRNLIEQEQLLNDYTIKCITEHEIYLQRE
jgi:hypothetical protein